MYMYLDGEQVLVGEGRWIWYAGDFVVLKVSCFDGVRSYTFGPSNFLLHSC